MGVSRKEAEKLDILWSGQDFRAHFLGPPSYAQKFFSYFCEIITHIREVNHNIIVHMLAWLYFQC